MQLHASCAARDGAGVLLIGPSGSGKSDLMLRLLDRGFELVADDRVEWVDGIARPPMKLAGLIEVRGFGIVRLPYRAAAKVQLVVTLGTPSRLPDPIERDGLPVVRIDPTHASAPVRIALALDCIQGKAEMLVGALA